MLHTFPQNANNHKLATNNKLIPSPLKKAHGIQHR